MVNGKVVFAGIAIVLLLFMGWASMVLMRNSLNSAKLDAETAKSNVGIKLQDRKDTIPAMVNAVEASFKFQTKFVSDYAKNREHLDQANQAYQNALNDTNDPDRAIKMDQAIRDAQNSLGSIIINARTEAVPQANLDALTVMQNEVATRQNGISKFREDYNDAAKAYNKMLVNAPTSWAASYYGFTAMKLFEADVGAEKMPDTNISINI